MGIPVGLASEALERMDKRDAALIAANARIMELERSVFLGMRQVDNLADVLRRCQEKLKLCFEKHGSVYVGGTEHGHLMKMIDAALPPDEQK